MTHEEIAAQIYVDIYADPRLEEEEKARYIRCCDYITAYMPGYSIADFNKIIKHVWELKNTPDYDVE